MTDDLIARLRDLPAKARLGGSYESDCFEAADALEAKDKRIAFLEALISETNTYYAECIDTREEFRARIASLEAQLELWRKIAWKIDLPYGHPFREDLRAARAAMEGK